MKCKQLLLTLMIFLAAGTDLLAQTESNRFSQRLEWSEDANVLEYKVEIRSVKKADEVKTLKTEKNYITFSLSAGDYEYRVHAYDFLGREASVTAWIPFSIIKAVKPVITKADSKVVKQVENQKKIEIPLQAEAIDEAAKAEIINKETGETIEGKVNYSNTSDETEASGIEFPNLSEGKWVIKITNPGGLSTETGEIEVTVSDSLKKAREEKLAEEQRLAEQKRLEEERLAEEKRKEEERLAEQKRLEEERLAEQKRLEEERLVEEKRKEEERLAAEKRAEEERLAEEKRLKEERLAEQKRLEEERLAEEKRLEEERLAEQKRLEEERLAEQKRLEEERLAEEKRLEEERLAEQKRLEEERLAEQKRLEEERLAEEKRKEEERLAAEKRAEEERLAEQKRLEEERLAEEKRLEEERLAEEKRLAKEERKNRPAHDICFMAGYGALLNINKTEPFVFEEDGKQLMNGINAKINWLPIKVNMWQYGFEANAYLFMKKYSNDYLEATFPGGLFQFNILGQYNLSENKFGIRLHAGATVCLLQEKLTYNAAKNINANRVPHNEIFGNFGAQGGLSLVFIPLKHFEIEAGGEAAVVFIANESKTATFITPYICMGVRL